MTWPGKLSGLGFPGVISPLKVSFSQVGYLASFGGYQLEDLLNGVSHLNNEKLVLKRFSFPRKICPKVCPIKQGFWDVHATE